MGIKKRGAIYSVIALMLCVAVYLNWNYSKTTDDLTVSGDDPAGNKIVGQSILVDGTEPAGDVDPIVTGLPAQQPQVSAGDYFSQARLSRQKARDEAVSILNSTIENENTADEARSAANTNIQVMADNAQVESRIENLVIAKGYQDCVVFVNDSGINVIVSKTEEGLSQADVAKIKDIVLDEADVDASQIKIIETT